MKKILWLFSFEFAGIKKLGGLGEVPSNQTRWISDKYDITLFMPSHNVHNDHKIFNKLQLRKLSWEFFSEIDISSYYTVEKNIDTEDHNIYLGFLEGNFNGIRIILIYGKNRFSANIIDDPIIYSPKSLLGKFILYSLAIKFYIIKTLKETPEIVPQIIHCHDYHGIPAMINVRQQLNKHNINISSVFTIHLLSWPRQPLDFLEKCGLEDHKMKMFYDNQIQFISIQELSFYLKKNMDSNPSLEQIGAAICDVVTSVSESYLKTDIITQFGELFLKNKTEFSWNGCDWNYDQVLKETYEQLKPDLGDSKPNDVNFHENLRKYLILQGIGKLPVGEPEIESQKIGAYINQNLTQYPYIKDPDGLFRGRVVPFDNDGPLIMMTGRLSKMKGIDILSNAIPLVLKKHQDANFIIFLIPSEFAIEDIGKTLELVKDYPKNVRVLFGKVNSLYYATYLSADIYCAPSRWEPFGIMALEAMSLRLPVVATRVGGLQESILDLNEDPINGTGLLVPPNDHESLANAINNLLFVFKIESMNRKNSNCKTGTDSFIKEITSHKLQETIEKDYFYGSKIRENCIKRVETMFRWKIVSEKLMKIYEKAENIKNLYI